jgi:glycine cleavage system aminomethyltransferase T
VAETGLVDTKFTTTLLLTPSGTVIDAGTVATAVLLLEKATTAPPAGAFAVRVTVADDADPPCTVAGLTLTVSSVAVGAGGAGAVTVRVAVRVMPLRVAEITDVVVELTALVATAVVADVAPAGTVRLAGTVAAAVLLLDSDTTAPPDGAAAVSVTVAVLVAPPCTVDGLRLTELRAAAVTVHPESRALVAVAEPSFTSTVQSAGGE